MSSKEECNLKKIVALAREGNKEAFLALYNKYKDKVYKNCYVVSSSKDEALDLFQEIWLKIYLGIKNIKKPDYFPVWINKVIRNTIINYYKKQKTKPILLEEGEEVDNIYYQEEDRNKEKINNILKACSPTERYLLYLRYYEGLSIKEIANFYNTSEGAIKMRINRILRKLKGKIIDENRRK